MIQQRHSQKPDAFMDMVETNDSWYEDLAGVAGYLADKISEKIGEDRLIPLDGVGEYAYVDTEGCAVYLITIQRATLVPAGAALASPEART